MVAFILNVYVAYENDPHKCLFSRSYLKCITFMASFETLNIPITYELFCNSPKEGMIKGLWKNHSHEATVCTPSHRMMGACIFSDAVVFTPFPVTTQIPGRQKQRNCIPQQVYCWEPFSAFSFLWEFSLWGNSSPGREGYWGQQANCFCTEGSKGKKSEMLFVSPWQQERKKVISVFSFIREMGAFTIRQ